MDASATVIIRAVSVLRGILDDAVARRALAVNPAVDITLPRKVPREHVYLTHTQVQALATAAGWYRAVVYVACYCGLRWSEIVGMKVRDFEPDTRRLHVRRAVVQVGGQYHEGTPKSWERRTVSVPAFLARLLIQQATGKSVDDLLFPSMRGGYMSRPQTARGWWRTATRAAGVEGMRVHDMRATCASLAVQAGASVKALQRMLGHRSAAMTLDTYSGLYADDLDDVAQRLDRAQSALKTP
mgnify:FL=1